MPLYIVHGEDDASAQAWLEQKRELWVPAAWRPFNFHSFEAKKIAAEEFQNVLQSYPMGSEFRVVLLRELEKADGSRRKLIAGFLEGLPPSTVVICWFVPGPKDPKKLPLGAEWKELLKKAEFVKCTSRGPEEETSVFSLLDGLGERQPGKAMKSLRSLLDQGEAPLRLLAALTNQLRILWQTKALEEDGQSAAEIAKRLGIHPYRVMKGLKHSRNFKASDFPKYFDWLSRADSSLKTGRQEPEHLLELLVLRLSQR